MGGYGFGIGPDTSDGAAERRGKGAIAAGIMERGDSQGVCMLTEINFVEGKPDMTTRFLRAASVLSLMAVCVAGAPLSAQQAETPDTEATDPGSMAPSAVTLNPSTPEEQAAREAANSAQLEMSSAQLAQNAANQAEYDARRASYESQMKLYENTVESRARAEAEYAQIKQLYDAIHAQWEADVAACNAGNRKRCAQTPPPMAQ